MATLMGTAFGEPAMAALGEAVADAKGRDPLAPVLVVVATDRLGVSVRRGLARICLGDRNGIAGVSPITLRRLAEAVATPALTAEGRLPVTRPVLVGALHRLLMEEPGRFHEVFEHPDTARALARAHDTLRPLTPADVEAVASASAVVGDVVRVHRAIIGRLAGTYYDEVDLLVRAADLIGRGAATLPAVVVFLPARPDPVQAGLLRAVARQGHLRVIVGVSGVESLDRTTMDEWARLLDVAPAPIETAAPMADAVIVATDPDDEARAVVRQVMARLADGVPGHRIGVLFGSRDPYARLLAEHFGQAGIAVHGRGVRAASERMLGRSLRRLLALPSAEYRRDEVMALLAEGPVRWRGDRAPASWWERLSRDAGVVRGEDWTTRLSAHAEELRRRAEEDRALPDASEWAGQRDEAGATATEELAAFVADLRARMDVVAGSASWAECGHHLLGIWTDVLGAQSLMHLPDEERRVADSIERILRSLPNMDALGAVFSLDALRELVETELDADLDRVGRSGIGVHVAPVSDGAGLALDVVFVVGLAEGLFPPRPADDPLLPEAARDRTNGLLPTLRQRIEQQHHDFLAALASAPQGTGSDPRRILSFPRGDLRRGGIRVPSRWLVPSMAELSGIPGLVATAWEEAAAATAAIQVLASYSSAVLAASLPGTEQEWRQRAHASGGAVYLLALEVRARMMRAARRGTGFTRFDGNVGSHPALVARTSSVLSPTSLETWFGCPHRYLVQHVLGVREIEQPEEIVQFSARDKGDLLHRVLDRFLREAIASGEAPKGGRPWPRSSVARLDAIITAEFAAEAGSGRVGLLPLWRAASRGLREDLMAFLVEDDKRRSGAHLAPMASELAFGREGNPPVEIVLPDGRTLLIRGSIDRVDEGPSGLAVIDYKTGTDAKYGQLTAGNPTDCGRFLQLALYCVAARKMLARPDAAVQVAYWFITRRQGFRQVGFPVTDATLAATGAVLAVAVDGIGDGAFPPRPKEHSKGYACPCCDPDGLGERMSVERFEALLEHPRLADYREVICGDLGRIAGEEAVS